MARLAKTRSSVQLTGFDELRAALRQLPKATQGRVARRAITNAAKPMLEQMQANVPVLTGRYYRSFSVSKVRVFTVGKAAFAQAMSDGLGKGAAVAALRDAQREAGGAGNTFRVTVGSFGVPYAHLVEFGSIHHPPSPAMRSAFETTKAAVVISIKTELGAEIDRAWARLQKRQAKLGRVSNG